MLRRVARVLVVVAIAGLASACGGRSDPPSQPPTPPPAEASNGLVIVEDTSQVCMINNQYMGRTQIRVEVEGRTYWGCCPACKDRLTTDAAARQAKDPVTGEVVDKAHAVIAKDARNAVLYFASAQNVREYRRAL